MEVRAGHRLDGSLDDQRRRVGSLSVWTEEAGLLKFVGLADHLKIMDKYRPRGEPLRSAKWWLRSFRLGVAIAEGQSLLDGARSVESPLSEMLYSPPLPQSLFTRTPIGSSAGSKSLRLNRSSGLKHPGLCVPPASSSSANACAAAAVVK